MKCIFIFLKIILTAEYFLLNLKSGSVLYFIVSKKLKQIFLTCQKSKKCRSIAHENGLPNQKSHIDKLTVICTTLIGKYVTYLARLKSTER